MNKKDIYLSIQNLGPLLKKTCQYIWHHPEVSDSEKQASQYYKNELIQQGFTIKEDQENSFAFYGEYGSGKPVIAILGEYDALPGLSQKVCTSKNPIEENGAGHGCGHNLLGGAALIAAIAIKNYLEKCHMKGTIRFYGCPAEELLKGKVEMIAHHMFDNCDVALSWHPSDINMVHDQAYLANTSMKFYFSGKTSHAGFAPERGRSALDAVELMSVGCNYLREHVMDKVRIHYTTDSGDFSPNIVPDKASAWYIIRAPKMEDVKEVARRVELVAKGAAMMSETTVFIEQGYGTCELKENHAFADLFYQNLLEAQCPQYAKAEQEFARDIQNTIDKNILKHTQASYQQNHVLFTNVADRNSWKENPVCASSDSGDVSYIMPTGLFNTVCWPIGIAPHTWQATACAGSTIGEKGALYAAEILAGSAYDLLTKPEILKNIQAEFNRRDDGTYQPTLPKQK